MGLDFFTTNRTNFYESANVICPVGQADLTGGFFDPYTPEEGAVHRVLHETECMFNQCASATFFARFVFDIQFLQNLLDFLAVIGAVCV